MRRVVRKGKADAVNKIIQNSIGTYLVFINSDALPDGGSIYQLLSVIEKDDSIGLVSGRPSFSQRNSATSFVEQLMWNVHNDCSFRLNHLNESNHGSDEMMVVRTDLLQKLPIGLVNDGAYIAGRARHRGYSIKFCPEATVQIDVPAKNDRLDKTKTEDHFRSLSSLEDDWNLSEDGRISPAHLSPV